MHYDELLTTIADYVVGARIDGELALDTARLCLADSLGCAIRALEVEECRALLGPWLPVAPARASAGGETSRPGAATPGAAAPGGARVPGTGDVLDPVKAAFDLGTMIRWHDYNDTWLAAEWGHPSDNIAAVLAVAQSLGREMTVGEILPWIVKAYEIQGVIALTTAFNRIGLDHVILVKVASGAVAAGMMGARRDQVADVLSNLFIDNGPLRTYRHFPNTGSRKSWAAGDSGSRGVQLALMVMRGAMGYPAALSAARWGVHDVLFGGKPVTLSRPLGSYVIENILFKVSFPAEFHAQTAVECGFALHEEAVARLDEIERVVIETQESAVRIIDKSGPLHNPADRDHCIQYMTACALLYGELTPFHYTDGGASDPRIDRLREKMTVTEHPPYSRDYLDPQKRSIGNSVQLFYRDGGSSRRVAVEYPIGHPRRRDEARPLLREKLRDNLRSRYDEAQTERIVAALTPDTHSGDGAERGPAAGGVALDAMTVGELVALFG